MLKKMHPKDWLKNKQTELQTNGLASLMQQSNMVEQKMFDSMSENEIYDYMISKLNFCQRKQNISCRDAGIDIKVGDICFIDYGMAYQWEIGYQHMGLILSIKNGKTFVVPISGSPRAVEKAKYRSHLFELPKIACLNKRSVLYLNDAKWINSSRIIDIKAHLYPNGILFKKIKEAVIALVH